MEPTDKELDDTYNHGYADPKHQVSQKHYAALRHVLSTWGNPCAEVPDALNLTELASVCASYRSDFGGLPSAMQASVIADAQRWEACFREHYSYKVPAPPVWKDDDTAALVNSLTHTAKLYAGHQSLRGQLAKDVHPLVNLLKVLKDPTVSTPSFGPVKVGALPTMTQDDYPGLGAWWVQLRVGAGHDEILARVYGANPVEARNRALAMASALGVDFGTPTKVTTTEHHPTKVLVDASALQQLLQAALGPPHLMAELRVLAKMEPMLNPKNPLGTLVDQYNEWASKV